MLTVARRLALLLIVQTTGSLLVAGESSQPPFQTTLSANDFAYYRQSKPIIDSILSGEFASADSAVLAMAELDDPQALVFADVHATIGIAYGESGYFEAGIAHIQKALGREHGDIPHGLVSESLAYSVYYHAALSRFDDANRLLDSIDTPPPWLFDKLAVFYAPLDHLCATANAEASLRLAQAGGRLVSHWASRHTNSRKERDALIRDWSARLEALRSEKRSPSRTDTPPCVAP